MIKNIVLNNNNTIPQIGLGTWRLNDEKLESALPLAIELGYRHIDTALVYENEKQIGDILQNFYKQGKIKREDLFITSKLWNTYHDNPELAIETTLNDLQTDYLDLYIIHWPVHFEPDKNFKQIRDEKGNIKFKKFEMEKLWLAMESFVKSGKVKNIGFSNFGIENISKILKICSIRPSVCQFELHPYLQQRELVKFCEDNKIAVTSYSSLGSLHVDEGNPNLKEDATIKKIADKYKVSVSQIILSWLVSKNFIVIPKSSSKSHLEENISMIDLSKEDILEIENIQVNFRYVDIPSFGPDRFK